MKMASMMVFHRNQEQNSFGITNKLLKKKADAICVAYENLERFFPIK
jgi:UDP-N-acetylglucosamine:LPS N-acetylglucosamine transferase